MAHKTISREELRELLDDGAEISFDQKQEVIIKGLENLIEKIEQSTSKTQQSIESQEKQVNQLLQAFKEMIESSKNENIIDTKPIAEAIKQIKFQTIKESSSYIFTIERDNRGFMKSVEAKAVN